MASAYSELSIEQPFASRHNTRVPSRLAEMRRRRFSTCDTELDMTLFPRFLGPTAVALAMLALAGCHKSSNPPPPTRVSGTVTSGFSALDQYVTVTLSPAGGGTATTLPVAAAGTFSADLAAGFYDVTATRPGYATYQLANFEVVANQTTTLDIALTRFRPTPTSARRTAPSAMPTSTRPSARPGTPSSLARS
ncbi:MAG: hypothetical protein Fur0037_15670 [Planctomycetota bacterium]